MSVDNIDGFELKVTLVTLHDDPLGVGTVIMSLEKKLDLSLRLHFSHLNCFHLSVH